MQYRFPAGLGARRPRLRQPVHRCHDRGHRRLRGGGARVEPGPRRARPGAARHERAAQSVGAPGERSSLSRARSPSRRPGSPSSHVFIEPSDVRANPEAIERILEADMIVIGPGKPLLERPAEPADQRHSRRPSRRPRACGCTSATSRPSPARRAASPPRGHLEALFEHVGDEPDRLRAAQPHSRGARAPERLAGTAGGSGRPAARGAAGHHRRGEPGRPGQRAPSRPGQAGRRADAAAAGGSRRPAPPATHPAPDSKRLVTRGAW